MIALLYNIYIYHARVTAPRETVDIKFLAIKILKFRSQLLSFGLKGHSYEKVLEIIPIIMD
jgi:hypothetical protein